MITRARRRQHLRYCIHDLGRCEIRARLLQASALGSLAAGTAILIGTSPAGKAQAVRFPPSAAPSAVDLLGDAA